MLTKKVSSSKDDCPKELKTELHLIIFENIKHFYLFRNTCSNNFFLKIFYLVLGTSGILWETITRAKKMRQRRQGRAGILTY